MDKGRERKNQFFLSFLFHLSRRGLSLKNKKTFNSLTFCDGLKSLPTRSYIFAGVAAADISWGACSCG